MNDTGQHIDSAELSEMLDRGHWPRFPLPAGSVFGPRSGPVTCISGHGEEAHRRSLFLFQVALGLTGATVLQDGLYGPETRRAVMDLQRANGLAVDGLIGPATWDAAWGAAAGWPRGG